MPMSMTMLQAPQKRSLKVIEELHLLLKQSPRMSPMQALSGAMESLALLFQPVPNQLPDIGRRIGHLPSAREHSLSNDLCRCTRCRGPHVRNKIADGEINLMPHSRNNGDR